MAMHAFGPRLAPRLDESEAAPPISRRLPARKAALAAGRLQPSGSAPALRRRRGSSTSSLTLETPETPKVSASSTPDRRSAQVPSDGTGAFERARWAKKNVSLIDWKSAAARAVEDRASQKRQVPQSYDQDTRSHREEPSLFLSMQRELSAYEKACFQQRLLPKFMHRVREATANDVFDFCSSGVGDDQLVAIFSDGGLVPWDRIRRWRLRDARMRHLGAQHLAKRLNEEVEAIDLAKNEIGFAGALRLSSAFLRLTQLRRLDLSGNGLSDDAANVLAGALAGCPKLLRLDLQQNALQEDVPMEELLAKDEKEARLDARADAKWQRRRELMAKVKEQALKVSEGLYQFSDDQMAFYIAKMKYEHEAFKIQTRLNATTIAQEEAKKADQEDARCFLKGQGLPPFPQTTGVAILKEVLAARAFLTDTPAEVMQLPVQDVADSKEQMILRAVCDERISVPVESLQQFPEVYKAILQLVLDEPPEGLYNRWVKERLEYYRRVEPSAPLRDVSIVDQKDSEASISLSSDTDESVDTQRRIDGVRTGWTAAGPLDAQVPDFRICLAGLPNFEAEPRRLAGKASGAEKPALQGGKMDQADRLLMRPERIPTRERELREPREPQPRELREPREPQPRELREPREPQPRELREPREPRQPSAPPIGRMKRTEKEEQEEEGPSNAMVDNFITRWNLHETQARLLMTRLTPAKKLHLIKNFQHSSEKGPVMTALRAQVQAFQSPSAVKKLPFAAAQARRAAAPSAPGLAVRGSVGTLGVARPARPSSPAARPRPPAGPPPRPGMAPVAKATGLKRFSAPSEGTERPPAKRARAADGSARPVSPTPPSRPPPKARPRPLTPPRPASAPTRPVAKAGSGSASARASGSPAPQRRTTSSYVGRTATSAGGSAARSGTPVGAASRPVAKAGSASARASSGSPAPQSRTTSSYVRSATPAGGGSATRSGTPSSVTASRPVAKAGSASARASSGSPAPQSRTTSSYVRSATPAGGGNAARSGTPSSGAASRPAAKAGSASARAGSGSPGPPRRPASPAARPASADASRRPASPAARPAAGMRPTPKGRGAPARQESVSTTPRPPSTPPPQFNKAESKEKIRQGLMSSRRTAAARPPDKEHGNWIKNLL
ncbi:unnamed protein product [Effrenium voratum]|uniref:Uncharacterized protein n=1 Tax=Effrenium voratum TaxID=2562239 RepID=A0AA36JAG6_9DINO|nr:unnamed protein product [Effrenium voratum]